jgi:transcriptional regulator with XRE-family HTH domain
MRRKMLGMSQEKLADALGLTFQQVQKYEKGANRVGASRLQHIAQILKVPVTFFFDGGPVARLSAGERSSTPSPDDTLQFVATAEGLALIKAFMRIERRDVRLGIVQLVKVIAGEDK